MMRCMRKDSCTFAGGLGKVFDIQPRPTTYPVYTPAGMSIMAKYLGPVDVVVAAMMKAMTAKYSGSVMWKYLSPVLSACQAFKKDVMTARM